MRERETAKQKHREACDKVQAIKAQISELTEHLEEARDQRAELEGEVATIETDLKKAQEKAVEFYARSTQAKSEKDAEPAQPDSARDGKPNEEYTIVGETPEEQKAANAVPKHSKKN